MKTEQSLSIFVAIGVAGVSGVALISAILFHCTEPWIVSTSRRAKVMFDFLNSFDGNRPYRSLCDRCCQFLNARCGFSPVPPFRTLLALLAIATTVSFNTFAWAEGDSGLDDPSSVKLAPDEWSWSEPVNLSRIVNTKSMEAGPTLSTDGLTLLFVSDRPGGLGKQDIWMCTRAKPNGPWSKPVNLGRNVNTNWMDGGPSLSFDGLTLFFASNRPHGVGGYDLWKSTRSMHNASWGTPVNLGATINSPQSESSPTLSRDGLTLLFSSTRPGGHGSSDIWMSTRTSVNSPWGKPVNLGPSVNSKTSDEVGDLSSDGRTLIFGSFVPGARPGKGTPFVLWMSTRPNVDRPFGKRIILGTKLNRWATASGASLSADDQTLLFHSNHRGGQGGWDLWSVQRQRKRSVSKVTRRAPRPKHLSTKDLQAIVDGVDARRDDMLVRQMKQPYPPRNGTRGLEIWHSADFALAALHLNQRVAEANAALVAIPKRYPVNPDPTRGPGQPEVKDYHWHINLLLRIYFLFNHRSKSFPGRLSKEAENALLKVFWDASRRHCRRSYADPNRTWSQWGSENHHAMSRCGFWGAAQALRDSRKYRTKRYADGSTPAQMCTAWERYFRRCARERAAKGLMIEIGSTYNSYTLQGWYNMVDFSTNAALRRQMKQLLDLFWADWAIEQIDAIRGGSKHRCYPGRTSTLGIFCGGRGEAWFHFAVGTPRSQHPSVMCAATSTYRPPLCVVDMVYDPGGRGEYEYISRRPGLNRLPKPKYADWQTYVLNETFGGILRYSYCAPSFIMGTSMIEARPYQHWSNISSQNRWEGVIFSGDQGSGFPDFCPASTASARLGVQPAMVGAA